MATKQYLDEEGLEKLVEYINRSHLSLKKVIELLIDSEGTPGSIQKMIEDAIADIDIADLQQGEIVRFYGGSASDVMEEVNEG